MAKVRVRIVRDFRCDARTLFNFMSEHETLARLFAPIARFKRLRDGQSGRNTVGSARLITVLGFVSFVETYTQVEPDARLEYVVSDSALIKNHLSVVAFAQTPSGSRLVYTTAFDGKLPLVAAIIAPGLGLVMRLAFYRLKKVMATLP